MQERQRHVEHVFTDRTLGVALYGSYYAVQQQQQQLSQASLDAGEAKAGGAPSKYTGHWVLHCMEASTLCSDSSSSFHRPL